MACHKTHADNSKVQQTNSQLDASTLAQLEEVWGGRGQGKLSFGEGVDQCIRCSICPATGDELQPGCLGWVERMYVGEVPFGSNVVASTLFGREDRRQVVLNTTLGKEIKELWSNGKVCDRLLLSSQTLKKSKVHIEYLLLSNVAHVPAPN